MARGRLHKLECIRGFAAVYVVFHHFARLYMPHRWYAVPLLFGPEAVMLFFVLSGFVIFCSTRTNPLDLIPRNYAIKRIRRIYPIFLCALLLGYLCRVVNVGQWFDPNWKTLAGNLVMLQDFILKPGVWIGPFYDEPLWSLSYECWFYLLFIVLVHSVERQSLHQYCAAGISLAGIVSYLIIPNQISLFLMYFMIWWCGIELAREFVETGLITWRRQIVPLAMLSGLAVLWCWPLAQAIRHHEHLIMNVYPMLICRHIFAAIAFIFVGIAWLKLRFVGFEQLIGSFAIFAPISYAIYVVHLPIMNAMDHVVPGEHPLLKLAAVCLLTVLLAYVLELRMQPVINDWSKRFLTRGPHARPVLSADSPQNPALDGAQIVR